MSFHNLRDFVAACRARRGGASAPFDAWLRQAVERGRRRRATPRSARWAAGAVARAAHPREEHLCR